MADYFTSVSFTVRMPQEQADWLIEKHQRLVEEGDKTLEDLSDEQPCVLDFGYTDGELYVANSEGADPEYIAWLLQHYLKHFDLAHAVYFAWAETASSDEPHAFGGGAYVVTKDAMHAMSTSAWIEQTLVAKSLETE